MPRDAMILLYVSIPFVVAAATLFVLGEWFSGGWDGLARVVYGAIVAGIWAVVVLGYLAWILLRDGLQVSSIVPATVLIAAFVAASVWGGRILLEKHHCRRSGDFFVALAHADPADRAALIARNDRYVREPTWCGLDMVNYWLGLDVDGRPVAPGGDDDRLAALRRLLEAGLAPDDKLVYHAARSGDVAALRLLTERRRALNADGATGTAWDVYPLRPAHAAMRGYELAVFDGDAAERERYAETMRLFVAGGVDVCAPSDSHIGLAVLMTRADLPWRDWLPEGSGDCGPARVRGAD